MKIKKVNPKRINLITRKQSKIRKTMDLISRAIYKLNPNKKIILPGSSDAFLINLTKLNNFDAYLLLGGSLFIFPSKGMDCGYSSKRQIILSGIPYFIAGANFGPAYNKKQVNEYHKLFKFVKGASFRDKYSYSLFKDLGDQIQYHPDIVFGLDVSNYHKTEDFILISVINPESSGHTKEISEKYFNYICNLARHYSNNGEKVVLMSFCEPAGDLNYISKILATIHSNNITAYNHNDVEKSLQMIAKAKKIIATRYHAMILAWIFEKDVYVISYNKKTTNVISDLFPKQNYVDIKEISSSTKPKFSKMPTEKINYLKSESLKHFDKFKSFTIGE